MKIYKTDEVYGINREIPLNYIKRDGVDNLLEDSLERSKHIVIFGGSKQGKTCLRKKCIPLEKCIIVQCSNKFNLDDLNANILKQTGYELTQSTKKTASGKNKVTLSAGAKIMAMFSANAGMEIENSDSNEVNKAPIEIDMGDVNDIILALNQVNFDKYIILEDFHYLRQEVQVEFSFELKAFHENSKYCFVIVGVWSDENRITVYNGDLTSRVISVNADKWSEQQLLDVINRGEELLNVEFSAKVKREIVSSSLDNVYVVQEACLSMCREENITETQNEHKFLNINLDGRELVKAIVNQQSGRYVSFLINFAEGFQDTNLQMHKWLLYPVLKTNIDKLERGLIYSEIRTSIKSHHPRGDNLNLGNLTQALKSVTQLEVGKNIRPIILDYDDTNLRLNIVDRGFLIWLKYQDRNNLLEQLDLPTDEEGV